MGFNTKGTSSKNENVTIKITAGHKVECEFTGASADDKGNITFGFKNDTGVLNYKMFNIDESNYVENDTQKIKHLVCAFLDEAVVDAIEAANFAAWAAQIVAMLEPTKGTKCKLHVVINKKGYPTLPMFTNFISTAKSPCDWNSDPKYHRYVAEEVQPDAAPETDSSVVTTQEEADFQGWLSLLKVQQVSALS